MSANRMAVLVEDARLMQLAGVVITRRDWRKMTSDERVAWITARAILSSRDGTQKQAGTRPREVAADAVGASPTRPDPLPSRNDLLRQALEDGARDILAEKN